MKDWEIQVICPKSPSQKAMYLGLEPRAAMRMPPGNETSPFQPIHSHTDGMGDTGV